MSLLLRARDGVLAHRLAMPQLAVSRRARIVLVVGTLAGLFAIRGLLVWLTLARGFVEYNADGFSRVIRGYEWLQVPRWEVSVWLPLHFWMLGGSLAVWNDVYITPKVLSFVAGLVTIGCLYGIGATLHGWRTGLIAAGMGAVFPFEVWFSVSGMAEPIFHAFLTVAVLGFAGWWRGRGVWWLVLAGAMLCAATAMRYEGWFYAAVFVPLVLAVAWHRQQLHPGVVTAALLSGIFMLVWIQQSAVIFGDPLAFARETAAIKTELAPENIGTPLIDRLIYFPETLLRTSPLVVLFGLSATGWLLWTDRGRWAGYLELVWGQAIVFILVSAAFANIGPGSERYLLSNVILLLPPVAAVIDELVQRARIAGLVAAAAFAGVLLLSFASTVIHPPREYPDEDARQAGAFLSDMLHALNEGDPRTVQVLLPPPPTDAYNAGYALRILSGHPSEVQITDHPDRLVEAIQTGEARFWVIDTNVDVELPAAEWVEQVGRFAIGASLPGAHLSLQSSTVLPGETLVVSAHGFELGEVVDSWITAPDGAAIATADGVAGADGNVILDVILPSGAEPGEWAITLRGQSSSRQGVATFEVEQ